MILIWIAKSYFNCLKVIRQLGRILRPQLRLKAVFPRGLSEILQGEQLVAVDVGGALALQPHWEKLIGNTVFHIFEPHPESYQELVKHYQTSPSAEDFRMHKVALSGSGGPRILRLTNQPTGSSILEFDQQSSAYYPENSYLFPIQEMAVETKTLSESLPIDSVSRIDLVKLDIQGAELEVLQSLEDERLRSLLAFEMEVNIQGLYLGGTSMENLTRFAQKYEFDFFDFHLARENFGSSLSGRLVQKHFDTKDWNLATASKAWEFDVIAFKKASAVLKKKSPSLARRLIACYCVYNFYFQALEVTEMCRSLGLFDQKEADQISDSVLQMKRGLELDLFPYQTICKATGNENWGQYMWFKFPST